jgi:hypothetical protein
MVKSSKSVYTRMYLVTPKIYEKLLSCVEEADRKIIESLNQSSSSIIQPQRLSESIMQDISRAEILGESVPMEEQPTSVILPPSDPVTLPDIPEFSEEFRPPRTSTPLPIPMRVPEGMRLGDQPSESISEYHTTEGRDPLLIPSEPSYYETAEESQISTGTRPKTLGPYYRSRDMPTILEEEVEMEETPKLLGPYYRPKEDETIESVEDIPLIKRFPKKPPGPKLLGPYYRPRDVSLEDVPLRKRYPKKPYKIKRLGPYYRSRDLSAESLEDIPLRKRFPKKILSKIKDVSMEDIPLRTRFPKKIKNLPMKYLNPEDSGYIQLRKKNPLESTYLSELDTQIIEPQNIETQQEMIRRDPQLYQLTRQETEIVGPDPPFTKPLPRIVVTPAPDVSKPRPSISGSLRGIKNPVIGRVKVNQPRIKKCVSNISSTLCEPKKEFCLLCEKYFASAYNLRRHLAVIHKMTQPQYDDVLNTSPIDQPWPMLGKKTKRSDVGYGDLQELITPRQQRAISVKKSKGKKKESTIESEETGGKEFQHWDPTLGEGDFY